MGSDVCNSLSSRVTLNFNPRSPHGERLPARSWGDMTMGFQSTLPAWGATTFLALSTISTMISIHAPRMGSDAHLGEQAILTKITIPPPRWGSDFGFFYDLPTYQISIHAPRMGSDFNFRCFIRWILHFNPRSPHGERR